MRLSDQMPLSMPVYRRCHRVGLRRNSIPSLSIFGVAFSVRSGEGLRCVYIDWLITQQHDMVNDPESLDMTAAV